MLTTVHIPQACKTVLPASGAQRTIRGDGHGADVVGVLASEGVEASAGLEVPDLSGGVPAAREDLGGSLRSEEAQAADPVGVSLVGQLRNALTLNVPHANDVIAATRDNLAVIRGEGHCEHILGVAHKLSLALTGGKIPETERAVP